ncbi:ribosome small subunit-dependent GTPase A [Georgenia yuyongxinii]|uniref:Small ribosomal subunit biogenesis GTPase RsgA n=1 Tax=Georgenia yuyongxinii TaxID=2589797 RepID=A0A5B8C609_9MICO|nr:ribosome small subunit-dependent GTPase A [Georgenia yuyongxinii]QDC23416.1 ribosome small subunit-dependent GTPase A [Georgenia yuyongxinii]
MLADLSLTDLGWDDRFAESLPADTLPARVVRVDRGAALVHTADGVTHVRLSAQLRRTGAQDPVALPCAGDWVALHPLPGGGHVADVVLPRRTAVVRGGVARLSRGGLSGDGQGQVLAANVDVVLVAEPARHAVDPADLGRIERLVALAWESGAVPVVVVTKADLLPTGLGDLLDDVAAATPGAEVHAVAALDGQGLDAVRPHLGPGRTAVVLGPSGAGKSTLVNALAGTPVMATQQVRAADGRGRHTTVHRELVVLPSGGLVIDTPGLRRVSLYEMSEGVDRVFADVEDLAQRCRFTDCGHRTEPGCAVVAAVDSGALPRRRLESWRLLQREAAWMATRTDARLRTEQTKAWRSETLHRRRTGQSRP